MRNQDGSGTTKPEFFFSLRISHPRSGNYSVCDGFYTHSVSHAHFSDTFSLRDVQTPRTRMAQGVCSAHVRSLHLTFSILNLHPPSLLFPDGHFETTFPTLTSAPSLPNCSPSESAGQAQFRTSGGEFGYLADPTHSTEPRVKLYVPRGASFPFPLKYIDVTRATSTSLDEMLE